MALTIFFTSREIAAAGSAILLLALCGGKPLLADSHPPAAGMAIQAGNQMGNRAASLPTRDFTQPEVQSNLNVDTDPVLSPDLEAEPQPAAPSAPTAKNGTELQQQKNGVYTLQEDVNEVLLSCTVVDDKGLVAPNLRSGDFRVWENGVPQKIDSFHHQDVPVSMGILVDNSGSMRDKRAAVDAAALDLVRASNRQDGAFVVNFSDRAYLDQGLTSNIAALQNGLAHFTPGGTTALYDAVAASANELANHAKQQKQVLLIITDGADNASRLTLEQTIGRVQSLGGPVVYSIGLLFDTNKKEAQRARQDLQTLSDQTGGVAYFPDSLQDVSEIAAKIARDIRDQYTVGYHPTRPVGLGGYRTVRVEASASDRRKLIVRTRRGYYPKTASPAQTAVAVQ